MGANVGNQIVSLLYHTIASTPELNQRQARVRQVGIYSGGWLSIVDASHALVSPFIAEITDGTYQIRIRTQIAINILVSSVTPYIVIRWTYTGVAANDYASILAVATPSSNDLVLGLCVFSGGGSLNGFNYGAAYQRSEPNVQDLFLKVEPTGNSDLRVRIRGGRIHTSSGHINIPAQTSNLFTLPLSNSKIFLVYINKSTGALNIDSSGTESVSPSAPNYNGNLVLAEITLAYNDTSIISGKIRDVRNFITSPSFPDGLMLKENNDGKLTAKRCYRDYILIRDKKANGINGGTFTSGSWRVRDLTEITSDAGNHAGIGANRITLAAGTYEFRISCPAYQVNQHQSRLYNVTEGVVVAYGTSEASIWNEHSSAREQTRTFIQGKFTILTSKVFEVQHRCNLTIANQGFGWANNFGGEEVYTVAEFWKVE